MSRSNEAKALGVKMGQPYFQLRELVERHGLIACSSNYALYADLSGRVMRTLRTMAPRIEVYSIDEGFLDLQGVQGDLEALGRLMRARVLREVGIPVGVGIAPTKTLAKLANWGRRSGRQRAALLIYATQLDSADCWPWPRSARSGASVAKSRPA